MLHAPALLIGMAGSALVAATYVPLTLEARMSAPQISMSAPVAKGDRLVAASREAERLAPAIVEVVGVTNPTVILRAQDGSILYRSDPVSGTTSVARGAELPVVTVKERPDGPVAYHGPNRETPVSQTPAGPQEGNDGPRKERKRTVGCEAAVSSLVKSTSSSLPSRCLV